MDILFPLVQILLYLLLFAFLTGLLTQKKSRLHGNKYADKKDEIHKFQNDDNNSQKEIYDGYNINKYYSLAQRIPKSQKNIRDKKALMIIDAIEKDWVIEIQYVDKNGSYTVREIKPNILLRTRYGYKCIAHCYLRDAEREFYTKRMLDVKIKNQQ